MDNDLKPIPPIRPFQRFVIQNFPFIEKDFQDLDSYGLWCKVIEYVQLIAKSQNECIEEVEALINYINNLDLQEEVNNKLDAMAEDGTLQEIVASYLQANVSWTFDDVAEMKTASNLIKGSYAQTEGYYEPNDGGSSLYYITDTAPSDLFYETLNSGLYAVLITKPIMNVRQFGAKGDGLTDDADSLIACFNQSSNIVFNAGEEYLSSKNIVVKNSGTIDLNGAKISMYNRLSETTGIVVIFRIEANFTEIKNGELHGDIADRETHSQRIYGISTVANNVSIHNMKIYQFDADGITGSGDNVSIYDCEVYSCGRNNISMLYGKNITIHDVYTHDCLGVSTPGHGIDIEPWADGQNVLGLEIYNITGSNNYGSGVNISFYDTLNVTASVHDIVMDDTVSVKLSHKPSGYIDIRNISISNEFIIQDAVSTNTKLNIENVTIRDYNPVTTTSFWGSAVKIRSNVTDTAYTSLCNVNIKNLTIDGGTPTRGIYIDDAGHNGSNNSIDGIKCNINTISPITTGAGGLNKWKITNIQSDYVATITSNMTVPNLSSAINVNGNPTIASVMPYGTRIKLINTSTNRRVITSQGNNQYGVKTFGMPPMTECYITINEDGSILVESDKISMEIASATSYSFNLNDTNMVASIRSSHYNIFYVDYSSLISITSDSGTGATLSVSNGVLSVTGHETASSILYLMK